MGRLRTGKPCMVGPATQPTTGKGAYPEKNVNVGIICVLDVRLLLVFIYATTINTLSKTKALRQPPRQAGKGIASICQRKKESRKGGRT